MRRLAHISAAIALTISLGCSPQQEPKDVPAPPETPATAHKSSKEIVEDYGTGLVTSIDRAKTAQAKVDIREVQRVVQNYALDHDGAYPTSLDEISGQLAGIDLSIFSYNPDNGGVSLKGQ